jgi:hypothetical protein
VTCDVEACTRSRRDRLEWLIVRVGLSKALPEVFRCSGTLKPSGRLPGAVRWQGLEPLGRVKVTMMPWELKNLCRKCRSALGVYVLFFVEFVCLFVEFVCLFDIELRSTIYISKTFAYRKGATVTRNRVTLRVRPSFIVKPLAFHHHLSSNP